MNLAASIRFVAGPDFDPSLRSMAEAAARLGVSVRTLEKAVAARRVAVVRRGRRVLVRVAEIARLEAAGSSLLPPRRRGRPAAT